MRPAIWITSLGLGLAFTTVALGQAFTQADGAVEGYTPQGTGQALYGSLGLDSANDPEFRIYRKFLETGEQSPLSSATNVEGNLGEVEWQDVNQRQATPEGLQAPGMFIGQKNHQTEEGWVVSNPDQILYFKPLIDTATDANLSDSNRNAFWDTRFGFMESPNDFIDFVEPNSEQLDLWTGQFNTDAVYLQNLIRRDDSFETSNVTSEIGHGGSFKLQSGSEFTQIADERNRDDYELTRTRAGTGEELPRTGHVDTGVAYEDPIEVSWGMRLNDPQNPDEFLGREIEFWVKTGNIIAGGVFDPGGGEDSPTVAPPNSQDFEDFTDFIFDWQNAFPVFFAGAQGMVGGTGRMGIFIPGDFGADGEINLDDFDRLALNFGDEATTYARGDFTQDGLTDVADAEAWADLADASVKSAAVSAVEADAAAGGSMYDFDGTGMTDAADVTFITDLFDLGCVPGTGDFDGNGAVEFADFLVLSANFGQAADAAGGDIDCNGIVEFADFLVLSANFGQTVGGAQPVPEPTGLFLLISGCLALGVVRRRKGGWTALRRRT